MAASLAIVVVLPTPVGPTRATRRQRPGVTWIGPADADFRFDHPRQPGLDHQQVVDLRVLGLRPHPLDQFPGEVFVQVGVQQVGEELEQFLGQVVAGGVAAAAKLLDHGLQLGQLVLHRPRAAPAAAAQARRQWMRAVMPQHDVIVAAAFFFIRGPRRQAAGHVHAAGGGDFDLPRSVQPAEEPSGLDFAGMQHGRLGAQVVADHGQGFVHRRGSVGFEFHGWGKGWGLGLGS